MKTFYYKANIYEMPEEKPRQIFIEEIKENPIVALRLYKEDHCMAPYFIKEETQTVLLEIDEPERIIETEAVLLSKEEYDRKLRKQVIEKCAGCLRYDNDSNNLTGNDTELTLDGMCFQRVDSQKYNFKKGVEAFWKKFEKIEKKLRMLVKKERYKEAIKLVQEIYNRHINAYGDLLFGINNKKVVFIISGQGNSLAHLLADYVIEFALDTLKEKWEFYSYIPKDIYKYEPIGNYDVSKNPPKIYQELKEVDRTRYDLTFCCQEEIKEEEYYIMNIENYHYICSIIGENLLLNLACDMNFSYKKENFSKIISVEEFKEEIFRIYIPMVIKRFSEGLNFYSYQFTPKAGSIMRGGYQKSFTSCRELTFKLALYDEVSQIDYFLSHMNILCATLEMDIFKDSEADEKMMRIVFNDIVADLRSQGLVLMFGYEVSEEKLYVDMLVFDSGLCKKEIRKRSPELSRYNCFYTEIINEHRRTFEVDYEMNEVKMKKDTRLN